MGIFDLARALMASGLVARVFLAAGATLLVAAVLMAAAGRRFAGRVMGRALATLSLLFLLPTALIGTMARVAEPAMLYSPCAAEGELPQLPAAPPAGCLLAVEWQQAGVDPSCGLVVSPGAVDLPAGALGHWWVQSPTAAQQHIAEFQAAHPECVVVDQR